MRYYLIRISDPITGRIVRTYSSLLQGGGFNPGSLGIEMDIPLTVYATPLGGAFIRIWGVSLPEISQASDLNGMAIEVFGGMSRGLPLANSAQSGLLVQGVIQQAFGNWVGNDQSLDLILNADGGTNDQPKNIVLNWRKGQPLATAIANTLRAAFPTYTLSIDIDPSLVLDHDEPAYFNTIGQFAAFVKQVSQNIKKGDYRGVDIVLKETTFSVYDTTSTADPFEIKFQDLIGQPTWIGPAQIQFKTVMRGDLDVGDFIKLPPSPVINTSQALSQFRNKSVFQGIWQISQLRHIGNFRQPDAMSWNTTFDVFPAG